MKSHLLGTIRFDFTKDELLIANETKRLDIFYGGSLNMKRLNNSKHGLLPYQRIKILYDRIIHCLEIDQISSKYGVPYSTIRYCINL